MTPMASPIVVLFFGGFVLAGALNKYNLDLLIAQKLLHVCGTRPSMILLGFMCITALLSMWVSNTATAAMMIVMARPIIGKMKQQEPFRKSLPLAIAFGANVGGMGTPVGTPPNAIGIGILSDAGIHIGFMSWMLMAIPIVIISLAVVWTTLMFFFPPQIKEIVLPASEELNVNPKIKYVSIIGFLPSSCGPHQVSQKFPLPWLLFYLRPSFLVLISWIKKTSKRLIGIYYF